MYRMCIFILSILKILNIFICWFCKLCADTAYECYNFVKSSYAEEKTMLLLYMLRSATSALSLGPTNDTTCDGIIPCVFICKVPLIIVFMVYYFFAFILEFIFLCINGILCAIYFFIKTIVLSLKSMLCHHEPITLPINNINGVDVVVVLTVNGNEIQNPKTDSNTDSNTDSTIINL